MQRANLLIAWLFTLILAGLEIYALANDSRYKWDFIFLMLLLWGVYAVRKRIDLHPLHYGLLGVFLLLHDFGMFGFYTTYPLGVEYDYWVHGFFGFVASLIVCRAYHFHGHYSPGFIAVATLVVMLGFSAFHEIFEYLGALLLGEGEGVLFIGAGDLDEWETQKDMVNNVVGAVLGLSLYYLVYFWRRKNTSAAPSE